MIWPAEPLPAVWLWHASMILWSLSLGHNKTHCFSRFNLYFPCLRSGSSHFSKELGGMFFCRPSLHKHWLCSQGVFLLCSQWAPKKLSETFMLWKCVVTDHLSFLWTGLGTWQVGSFLRLFQWLFECILDAWYYAVFFKPFWWNHNKLGKKWLI